MYKTTSLLTNCHEYNYFIVQRVVKLVGGGGVGGQTSLFLEKAGHGHVIATWSRDNNS